jgi:hypothetical protein
MLDGEALYSKEEKKECVWDGVSGWFAVMINSVAALRRLDRFDGLCRQPVKRKRPYTQEEMTAWAKSGDSLGWMVRLTHGKSCPPIHRTWLFPREAAYVLISEHYQRAKLLPDLSGIDESTVQGFEAEE